MSRHDELRAGGRNSEVEGRRVWRAMMGGRSRSRNATALRTAAGVKNRDIPSSLASAGSSR